MVSTRLKLEFLVAIILIISSGWYGFQQGRKGRPLVYTNVNPVLELSLREKQPQKHSVYKPLNNNMTQVDIQSRLTSPIVVTMRGEEDGLFTHSLYGKADDGYKRTEFSYVADVTPNWKISFGVGGGLILVGAIGYHIITH